MSPNDPLPVPEDDSISAMVRDFTELGKCSKAEVRRRILAYGDSLVEQQKSEIAELKAREAPEEAWKRAYRFAWKRAYGKHHYAIPSYTAPERS